LLLVGIVLQSIQVELVQFIAPIAKCNFHVIGTNYQTAEIFGQIQ
jgi:hypothetical protein